MFVVEKARIENNNVTFGRRPCLIVEFISDAETNDMQSARDTA